MKLRKLQEILIFVGKNSVIFEFVCFNNDRIITQHTPKCVEICDSLAYICSSNVSKLSSKS